MLSSDEKIESIKKTLQDEIVSLHTKMTKIVLYAGVSPKAWYELIENLEKKRISRLQFIREFLENLHAVEWFKCSKIWTQPNMTDDMWENYKFMFDKPTLIEQKQLYAANIPLRQRWTQFKEQYKERRKMERAGQIGEPILEDTDEAETITTKTGTRSKD